MKIKKTTETKKKLLTTALIIIAVGILAGGYFAYQQLAKDSAPVTKNQTTSGNSSTTPNRLADSPAQTEENSKTPIKNSNDTTSANNDSQAIQLTITVANQNGNTLQVRALINALWQNGTCTLTLTDARGAKITRDAKTQTLSNESTCAGFDIDVSKLARGVAKLEVSAINGSQKALDNKDITIE